MKLITSVNKNVIVRKKRNLGINEKLSYQTDYFIDRLKKQVEERDRFLRVPFSAHEIIKKMGSSFPLYLYMSEHITRPNPKLSGWWKANILPFYKEKKYLPFARHQRYIAEDYQVTQPTVSNWVNLLLDLEVITRVAILEFSEDSLIDVYSLGSWFETDKGIIIEVSYLEVLSQDYEVPSYIKEQRVKYLS